MGDGEGIGAYMNPQPFKVLDDLKCGFGWGLGVYMYPQLYHIIIFFFKKNGGCERSIGVKTHNPISLL